MASKYLLIRCDIEGHQNYLQESICLNEKGRAVFFFTGF